jgi:hypothetical protein
MQRHRPLLVKVGQIECASSITLGDVHYYRKAYMASHTMPYGGKSCHSFYVVETPYTQNLPQKGVNALG